jgi:hypothetical protein
VDWCHWAAWEGLVPNNSVPVTSGVVGRIERRKDLYGLRKSSVARFLPDSREFESAQGSLSPDAYRRSLCSVPLASERGEASRGSCKGHSKCDRYARMIYRGKGIEGCEP